MTVAMATLTVTAFGANECVKASSFGWNAEDATACLQAAIDSGAKKVVIDRQAGDWIVEPIFLRTSGQEVVVGDGVTVRAKKGAFKRRGDCLFRIAGTNTNVTLRGEGTATIAMNKRDYWNTAAYDWSEWRHTVSIYGVNATVRDLTILSSGGDGVYVAGRARNVLLENLVCRDHHRQGISIISVIGLRARNCRFDETAGTAPQCGIDIEPNRPKDRLEDIIFEDCLFDGNASHGIDLHLVALSDRTRPISVTFRRCVARGNRQNGISICSTRNFEEAVKGTVRFEDCTISGSGASALRIANQRQGALEMAFVGCTFDARGVSGTPVLFNNGSLPADFGGVTFERSRVLADVPAAKAVDYIGVVGTGIAPGGIAGTLEVEAAGGVREALDWAAFAKRYPSNPERLARMRAFKTTDVNYRAIAAGAEPLEKPTSTGWLRKNFTFVQHFPAAGDYPVVFRSRRLGKRAFEAKVQMRDAAGTDLGVFTIGDGATVTNVIHSNGAGIRRFEVSTGYGLVAVESRWPGQGVLADSGLSVLGGRNRRFYFSVPASASKVTVQIAPEEPCSAQLLRPDGTVAEEMPYGKNGLAVLAATRTATAEDEVWCVCLPRVDEDVRLRIGAPALPLASPSASAVLRSVPPAR